MNKGLFITFEGGDGSGKSTQISLLKSALEDRGFDVILTREPGGTVISEKIRSVILDPANSMMAPVTEAMLYAASRAQLVDEVIRPAVLEGKVVICDRFVDSSIAYQSFGRGLGKAVEEINSYAIGECMPDLTVYLRLDPEKGKGRISSRKQDRIEMESGDFHRRVSEGYDWLAEKYPERIKVIDASGSIEEISEQILTIVLEKVYGIRSEQ